MTKDEYISRIKRKYDYIDILDLEDTYEIAKRELFIALYSSNTSQVTNETEIPYIYEYKVLDAMKEIIEIGNMRNFTSYSENGWSWERPKNGLATYSDTNSKVGS